MQDIQLHNLKLRKQQLESYGNLSKAQQIELGLIDGQIFQQEVVINLEKGKKAGFGEIREWKGGKFQRTTQGWIPVKQHKPESGGKMNNVNSIVEAKHKINNLISFENLSQERLDEAKEELKKIPLGDGYQYNDYKKLINAAQLDFNKLQREHNSEKIKKFQNLHKLSDEELSQLLNEVHKHSPEEGGHVDDNSFKIGETYKRDSGMGGTLSFRFVGTIYDPKTNETKYKFKNIMHKDYGGGELEIYSLEEAKNLFTVKIQKAVDCDYHDVLEKAKDEHGKEKVHKVMKEFKEGTLKSSSGEKVTDRKQAIAIALSEAGLSKSMTTSNGAPGKEYLEKSIDTDEVAGKEHLEKGRGKGNFNISSLHKYIGKEMRDGRTIYIYKTKDGRKIETDLNPNDTLTKHLVDEHEKKYKKLIKLGAKNFKSIKKYDDGSETVEFDFNNQKHRANVTKNGKVEMSTLPDDWEEQKEIKKSFVDQRVDILKSHGEGSRGGKIVGHTRSGKPIYMNTAKHENYKNYDSADHLDAAEHHDNMAKKYEKQKHLLAGYKHREAKDRQDTHEQLRDQHKKEANYED